MQSDLTALLGESLTACRSRERNTFDTVVGANTSFVLFGAGGLGRTVLAALRDAGIEPLAFADNKLAGALMEGLRVLTPTQAAHQYGRSATFVVTIWSSWADTMQEQMQSLRELGCRTVISFIPLLWKFPKLLPHTQIDLPSRVLEQKEDVLRCFNLWADEPSRREFVAQIRWRMFADFTCLAPPSTDQYWQRDLIRLKPDAVFADAGAFDGDTVTGFVSYTAGQFRAAYAFEPDPQNMRALKQRLRAMPAEIRSKIHIFECAVAEKEDQVSFRGGSGPSSSLGPGSGAVRCVCLDDALPIAPDFIKYDIEGSELLALSGTRQWITRAHPALAVCAYHLQDHLWRIPLLIHSFHPSYRYYLRSHGQIWETVCYAIPE